MSNCCANSASVFSPFMAAKATFALKVGVWFRRGLLLIVSPELQAYIARCQADVPLIILSEFPGPPLTAKDGAILSDRVGYLPARQAKNRKNPFSDPVREVRVRIETGKILRVLSNDLDASAEDIADLYKHRWQIELFFRWVKQNLKIKKFLGASENAIRIQIAIALIAYLLLSRLRRFDLL